jgi:hypothetical protein
MLLLILLLNYSSIALRFYANFLNRFCLPKFILA